MTQKIIYLFTFVKFMNLIQKISKKIYRDQEKKEKNKRINIQSYEKPHKIL